jgi:hypothetical protein
MARWQYFTVSHAGWDPLDPTRVAFGRTDLDGPQYNCQMLLREGGWGPSELLQRYYLLGSNDKELTDLTDDQAQHLIAKAVESGRFGGAVPSEP